VQRPSWLLGLWLPELFLQLPCWVVLVGNKFLPAKTTLSHWQADANGKKTRFQGRNGFFCLDL
jgi:hypothetical protein